MLTRIKKPLIYLAGKIAPDDWRTEIFGHRFGVAPSEGDDTYGFDHLLDETFTEDMGAFVYGGPFFISCDHCCAHGPASHGAAPTGCLTGGAADGQLEMRANIWRVNCARIRRADFVFAYINEIDCFGTFVELGYAAALPQRIGVGIGRNITVEQFDDLWMARQCHNINGELDGVWLGSPRQTFDRFLAVALAMGVP